MRLTKKLATLAILPGSPPSRDQVFKPGQIGFDDVFIDLLREQQRDVDVDAFADELADGRQAGFGRRHLDHQVVAADRAAKAGAPRRPWPRCSSPDRARLRG